MSDTDQASTTGSNRVTSILAPNVTYRTATSVSPKPETEHNIFLFAITRFKVCKILEHYYKLGGALQLATIINRGRSNTREAEVNEVG